MLDAWATATPGSNGAVATGGGLPSWSLGDALEMTSTTVVSVVGAATNADGSVSLSVIAGGISSIDGYPRSATFPVALRTAGSAASVMGLPSLASVVSVVSVVSESTKRGIGGTIGAPFSTGSEGGGAAGT